MSSKLEIVRIFCTRGADWALVSYRDASGQISKCVGTFGCSGAEMVPGQIYTGRMSKKRKRDGSFESKFNGRPVNRTSHALKRALSQQKLNFADRSALFSTLRDVKTIINALENRQHSTLMSVPKIGKKKLQKMYDAYTIIRPELSRSSSLKKALPSLFEYLSASQKEAIEKCFKKSSEDAFDTFVKFVCADPWRIEYDTEYDTFKHLELDLRADFLSATKPKSRKTMIAKALVDLKITSYTNDPRWLRNQCICHIREHMKKSGDYWMPLRLFYLRMNVREIDSTWPCLCRDGFITLVKYAGIERFIKETFDNICQRYEQGRYTMPSGDVMLDEFQRGAVEQACRHPLFILAGGAGVGKTTVCEHIVRALGKKNVTCAAPTGKAAQRLQELVGIPTFTVHRLVYMSDSVEVPPILLLDEQSMQEPEILARLFKKRHFRKIIFVGDVGQLTSVGPGQFFRDLCHSEIPRVELTKIYRSDSFVASNGQKVRIGDYDLDTDDNSFEICRYEDQAQLVQACKDIYLATQEMPIVLCNTNAEVAELNYDLREICNPIGAKPKTKPINLDYVSANKWRYMNWRFGNGDTVINIRNYYIDDSDGKKSLKVANGEIGTVTQTTNVLCKVAFFGGVVVFNLDEDASDYLRPAYALTVNKAQGSEYDTVIVKSRTTWGDKRERFYTAITRAKKKCIVFEVGNSIEECVRAPVAKRKTFLLK